LLLFEPPKKTAAQPAKLPLAEERERLILDTFLRCA
jgi:hypothetical protein